MSPLSLEELARRRPVWLAMSDMFLDTDTESSRQGRADALEKSGYSMAELDGILIDEVSPVCGVNLFSATGVWAGFDAEWLEQTILRKRQSSFRWLRRLLSRQMGKLVADEWEATKQLMGKPR
ncbi:hypothetical protein [Hydrogenophaga sp. 5NK40-0174]|uniref:DUF7079 family protein n=1 Tax=Hydrogenophaga sp. 5NK40-0174 TaxID=3127649 RepID=UPI00310A7CB4